MKTQIIQVGRLYFLDYWYGNGWKNIGSYNTKHEAQNYLNEVRKHG